MLLSTLAGLAGWAVCAVGAVLLSTLAGLSGWAAAAVLLSGLAGLGDTLFTDVAGASVLASGLASVAGLVAASGLDSLSFGSVDEAGKGDALSAAADTSFGGG